MWGQPGLLHMLPSQQNKTKHVEKPPGFPGSPANSLRCINAAWEPWKLRVKSGMKGLCQLGVVTHACHLTTPKAEEDGL